MSSRTRVKICGITESAHARVAFEAGADAIGLVFYPASPRKVSVAQAAAIAQSLPPFVASVGLFVNAPAEEVRSILDAVDLDLLQFHGDETPEYCASFGRAFVRAVRMEAGTDLTEYDVASPARRAPRCARAPQPGGTDRLSTGRASRPAFLPLILPAAHERKRGSRDREVGRGPGAAGRERSPGQDPQKTSILGRAP